MDMLALFASTGILIANNHQFQPAYQCNEQIQLCLCNLWWCGPGLRGTLLVKFDPMY